jgi:hypothetical protein
VPIELVVELKHKHVESRSDFYGHYKLVWDEENPPGNVAIIRRSQQ